MTSKRLSFSVLCGLMLLASVPAAHAQWKWRDADGRTQYSDRPPPPGVADKDILSRPSGSQRSLAATSPAVAASPAAASAPGKAASGPSSRDKLEQERKAAEDKARDEAMADNCRQAKARRELLDSGVRIREQNEKGETIPMDDAARAAQQRQVQAVITANCK